MKKLFPATLAILFLGAVGVEAAPAIPGAAVPGASSATDGMIVQARSHQFKNMKKVKKSQGHGRPAKSSN